MRPLKLAVVFYGALAAVALLWGVVAGRPQLVFDPLTTTWARVGLGALAGLLLGGGVVLLSRISVAYLSWGQELYRWFSAVLGPMSRRDVLALAGLSSVGEELLFRGAMQPTLGLWITSAVFALMHFPPQPKFWPWTASAAAMGLWFGLLTDHSGNLAGAVIAHFVINYLNLGHVACFATTTPRAPIGTHRGE